MEQGGEVRAGHMQAPHAADAGGGLVRVQGMPHHQQGLDQVHVVRDQGGSLGQGEATHEDHPGGDCAY